MKKLHLGVDLALRTLDELRQSGIREIMNTEDTIQPSSRNANEARLFAIEASEPQEAEPSGRPRLRRAPLEIPPPRPPPPTREFLTGRAERDQVVMQVASLDSLLPEDHRARLVWEYVQRVDLSRLYEQVRAVEGRAGRDAIDPRLARRRPGILMALWLYATVDGVGSARQLAGLCKDHVAYRWICGGVSVNYHTLSDFRTAHPEVLDDLLTHSVAALMHEGLDVVNTGSDQGQMPPMVEQHEQRYGKVPDETLTDGGFAQLEDIEKVSSPAVGTTVYAPVQKPRKPGRDPHQPLPGDSATDCRVASTDGHAGGEADLQGAGRDGRVCERD